MKYVDGSLSQTINATKTISQKWRLAPLTSDGKMLTGLFERQRNNELERYQSSTMLWKAKVSYEVLQRCDAQRFLHEELFLLLR